MAAKLDIEIEQGSTWKMKVTLQGKLGPINITNYELEGAIKQTVYDSIEYPFSFEKADAANGIFYATVDPAVSESIDFQKGVYHIRFAASPKEKYRLFEGDVTISLE